MSDRLKASRTPDRVRRILISLGLWTFQADRLRTAVQERKVARIGRTPREVRIVFSRLNQIEITATREIQLRSTVEHGSMAPINKLLDMRDEKGN